jgi:hypothetical protein
MCANFVVTNQSVVIRVVSHVVTGQSVVVR